MSVCVFLAIGSAIEVIQGRVLSDDTALRKNWIFVLDQAEWLDGMVLVDVVGRCKKLVEFGTTGRMVSRKAQVTLADTLP